jgi:bacteriocin biosynthesis cyclodehydratase domain-containing protein
MRALREHRLENGAVPDASGVLAPMISAVAGIAAMEVAKRVGGFVPTDTAGRIVELNLVSFACDVRRVLKVPRCPECSDMTRRPAVALTLGPQIPGRG